ncbi:hypothetical protein [Rhizobium sp. SL42]|uniref:hypothetical protein n=1 Tax=Rhizobium sp. SL42 TaxID=2806346 RepID=UPI001F40B280|nr:hypothetical protein [Rhizobium sp. SL42]UJW76042.1 hypothetical protein IM739_06025 [Rhizobium sp. SL42]
MFVFEDVDVDSLSVERGRSSFLSRTYEDDQIWKSFIVTIGDVKVFGECTIQFADNNTDYTVEVRTFGKDSEWPSPIVYSFKKAAAEKIQIVIENKLAKSEKNLFSIRPEIQKNTKIEFFEGWITIVP